MFAVLDVGCGVVPRGNVNTDISRIDDGSRSGNSKAPKRNINKIRNLVICDAEHLPFKDSSFELVSSHHVIERLEHPSLMFKEMLRVSKDKIEVYCPHRLGDRLWSNIHLHRSKVEFHKGYFRGAWFYQICKHLNVSCYVEYSNYLFLPFDKIPVGLRFPLELHVLAWKTKIRKQ